MREWKECNIGELVESVSETYPQIRKSLISKSSLIENGKSVF